MTQKSIIDIEINDDAFKEFQASFNKFQQAVTKVPKAWKPVDDAVKASKNPFEKITAAVAGMNAQMKLAQTGQERFKARAEASVRALKTMGEYTKGIATSMKNATQSLLKFASYAAIFSGGSLFGLDKLGQAAGNSRRESQGLGITPGEHEAAKINFQKLVDVDSALQKIQDARTDLTKRYALNAIGVNDTDIDSKSNAELLRQLLPLLKKRFEDTGGTLQAAQANGLTQFADIGDLTRLKAITQEEIGIAQDRYDQDKKTLSISDQTQSAWQDFNRQLALSSAKIENTFISGLVKLAGPIGKLSDAFANAIKQFVEGDAFKKWVDAAADGVERFAKYLNSDDFKHDFDGFLQALDEMSGAVISAARFLGKIFNIGSEKSLTGSQYRTLDKIKAGSPELASALEDKLRNPSKVLDWNSGKMVDTIDQQRDNEVIQKYTQGLHADSPVMKLIASLNGEKTISAVKTQEKIAPVAPSSSPSTTTVQGSGSLPSRNNNPFDLRSWGNNPVENGFAKFSDQQAGVTAGFKNLLVASDKHQRDTIEEIVSAYAPASDNNNTSQYIDSVSKLTGFGANQHIDLHDPKVLASLGGAILKNEDAKNTVTSEQIQRGIAEALGGSAKPAVQSTAAQSTSTASNRIQGPVLPAPSTLNVNIMNNTGGNAIATVSALAAGQ